MKVVENAGQVVRRFYEAAVKRNLATARDCLTDDMVFEACSRPIKRRLTRIELDQLEFAMPSAMKQAR
jgi:hypothetical protein